MSQPLHRQLLNRHTIDGHNIDMTLLTIDHSNSVATRIATNILYRIFRNLDNQSGSILT